MSQYSMPAAANYHTPPASTMPKPRGYRVCDNCNAVESSAVPRFRLCGGCMVTQYCSPACQKVHWPHHKPLCQHTTAQLKQVPANSEEAIAKNLRRFTSAHTALLGWAGFQALQLKRIPANIRQNAFLIELSPQSHPESHRRFSLLGTHIVPRTYITDRLVIEDILRREERCRCQGGIGTLVIIIMCGGVSQVMPVEVDPPSKISWDVREDWEEVMEHFIDSGRTDFKPISTTSRGVYYG